jgi:hypothetical protein
MPVQKFRSVEEMASPWRQPGDPALYLTMARLWAFGRRTHARRYPPGVYRHRSIEALNEQSERWDAANFKTVRSIPGDGEPSI